MQYELHDYIGRVAAEIQRLATQRNEWNEKVKDALKETSGKFEEKEAESFMSLVDKAIEVDKMYAYYSSKMGDLRKQGEELQTAERHRDELYARYVERVRSHMQSYSGMQATADLTNYHGLLLKAIDKVKQLSSIEVEDRYAL